MANAMLKQHEPLRVPAGWNEQSRALIIQLERVLDDIYRHFRKLGKKDLDPELTALLATYDAAVALLGNTPMGTTATTATGAISEHNQAITTLNGKTTVKSLGSSDNLNDLNGASATGYYYITTGVANAPTGSNWTQLFVIGGSITTQIVYSSARMWLRAYTGNPLAWTDWKEFALKSDLVTVKQYSVTTTANTAVSPFGAFAQFDVSAADRAAYGNMVSAICHASSTNPAMCMVTGGEGGMLVYSMSAATFNVDVVFSKNRN